MKVAVDTNILVRYLTWDAEEQAMAYLGRRSAARVPAGALRRGTGETIRAALLSADLRDFTALSEATEPAAMIAALDAWFDRVAEAVHAFGGEVLKFIGDGVLGDLPGRRLAGPTGWTSPRSVPRSTWSAGSRGCADRSAGRC